MRCRFISFSLLLLFMFVGGTAFAMDAVQQPAEKSPPLRLWKKKTPLDQPLEEILPVNVNTTDAATLMKVPGINRTAARQIVNYRDRNGMYTSLDQLVGFSGISQKNIVQLQEYLVVE